jgi:cephalosporin hydroxylase
MEAVEQFLQETEGFEVDESREKFMVSFNTGGWLRKIHD